MASCTRLPKSPNLSNHLHHLIFGCPVCLIQCLTRLILRLTNDGNAILREIEVAHPAAKNMIELSRTQDEEVGDGTTSVIVLGTYIIMNADYKQLTL